MRGRRRQVVHAVLAGVRDQQRRGTVDVLGQHLKSPIRVAGESEILQLPMFPGQVALVIVGEHPVPPAVEFGAVPERISDRLEPAVRVSVDDAGAGFASLRHVIMLAPDFVKLDRSWVTGIDADPTRQAMVAGLSHFARVTGCDLVAEGIEAEAERTTLAHLDVAFGQGFLLGPPAPACLPTSR